MQFISTKFLFRGDIVLPSAHRGQSRMALTQAEYEVHRRQTEQSLTGPSEAMDGRSEPTWTYLRRVQTSSARFGAGLAA